ncbi:hypothetical protein [Planctomicrobium piriforme]|uniref:hypothetical protein n=1 Tax=Planctomicrobium piriforme TaxID=1576369 RepID=UPI001587EA2F|nr:hypothetical protein [Planctomicrobium piriforme]
MVQFGIFHPHLVFFFAEKGEDTIEFQIGVIGDIAEGASLAMLQKNVTRNDHPDLFVSVQRGSRTADRELQFQYLHVHIQHNSRRPVRQGEVVGRRRPNAGKGRTVNNERQCLPIMPEVDSR